MTIEFKEAVVTILEVASSGLSSFLSDPRTQGVLLGAFLTQGAAFFKGWLTTRKQAKAVRKILALEIDHNLGMLLMLRDIAKPPCSETSSDDGAHLNFDTDLFLLDFIAYGFHQKAFESQVLLLTTALTEAELEPVYHFYGVISSVPAIFNVVKEERTQDSLTWLIKYIEASIKRGNPLLDSGGLRMDIKTEAKAEPPEKPLGST